MADDQPARIELMKLKLLVQSMIDAFLNLDRKVNQLFADSNIFVAENTAALSVKDCTEKVAVFLKSNDDGSFGIYFPETTSSPANGRTIVSDLTGRKFVLFQ